MNYILVIAQLGMKNAIMTVKFIILVKSTCYIYPHSNSEISVVTKFTYLARNTSEWRSRARRVELCGCIHSSWTLKTILWTLGFGYSEDVLIWLFPHNSFFFLGKEMTLPSQFIFFSLEKKWLFPRKTDLCTKKLAKLIYAQRNGYTLVFRVMITNHRWKWTSRK